MMHLFSYIYIYIQYNTVKLNFKGSAVLLRFRDSFGLKIAKISFGLKIAMISFGLKIAKIKKIKIPDLIYLSVHPRYSV